MLSVESYLTGTGRGVDGYFTGRAWAFQSGGRGALLSAERARDVSFVAVFVFFKAALEVAVHLSAVRVRVISIISTISGLPCQKLGSPLVNLANVLFGNRKIQPGAADTLMAAV